jgi:hypothetical protein
VTGSCGSWQSDNQGVATVSGEGVITAQSSGSATISAMCQGMPAKGGVTLNLALKATPTLVTSATISISPESPFLFRARFQYTFGEAGGAYGVNVNFLNTQILNAAGVKMDELTNYNPSVFTRLWGTNHIGPGETRAVAEVFDYNGGGDSRVYAQFTASVTDDLGNTTTLSDTISESWSIPPGAALPTVAGRDPNAFRFAR